MSAKLYELHKVSLEEVAKVLRDALQSYFKSVKVGVVRCPDLQKPPYGLEQQGLSGNNVACDIGSMKYLLPIPDKSKRYAFDNVVKEAQIHSGHLFGAGAGPFFTHGRNCEMTASVKFEDGKTTKNATLQGVYDETTKTPSVIHSTDNNFAIVAQLIASEGKAGNVIEVNVQGRVVDGALYVFIREALTAAYGKLDRPVAVGGIFLLTGSKGRYHVLPEFPDHPVDTPQRVSEFLKFFEMDPPILGVGTLVSHDPDGIDLKLEHFHCYNQDKTLAGHFYWDTEPDNAHYKVFLTVAKKLLRIDPKF